MIALTENAGGRKAVTLSQLETACNEYEIESASLEKQIAALDADLAEVKNKHMASLKRQAGVVANREAHLRGLVESAPEMFTKPRTMVIAGVKIGYTTSEGKVIFKDDEENIIARLKKFFADDVSMFIRTLDEVNKDACRNLTEQEMAKMGLAIEGSGDVVLVKRTSGDVEKLINNLVAKLTKSMVEAK